MLYLLLKRDAEYASDVSYDVWKLVKEFSADSYQQALKEVPINTWGRYKLYEFRGLIELDVDKPQNYILTEGTSIGEFSK